MPPVKQQPLLGTQLQLEQTMDNLQLAPTDKELQKMEKQKEKEAKQIEKELQKIEKQKEKEAKQEAKKKAAPAAPMTASAAYGFLFEGNNHWEDKTLGDYLTERYVVSYLDAHSFTQDGVSLEIDTPDDFPDSLAIEDLYFSLRVLSCARRRCMCLGCAAECRL